MLEGLLAAHRRYDELSAQLSQPDAASDIGRYRALMKEYKELEPLSRQYLALAAAEEALAEAKELLYSHDAELSAMAAEQKAEAEEEITRLTEEARLMLLPHDLRDDRSVIMELRAGTGGEEAALFAADLYRMYNLYAAARGWQVELMNAGETELGGYREIVFSIEGEKVFSRLKFESGIHRVQRVPETESGGRIHTSTCTVAVLPQVDEVLVVCRPADVDAMSALLPQEKVSFVFGGKTRQESVQNAVDTIDDCDLLLIHDGARPLVTRDEILDTLHRAEETGAAATGVFVKDTIKVINDDYEITDTPDRSQLIAIQTPQIFRFDLYKQAMEKAKAQGGNFTDDCKLMENLGVPVSVVIGEYTNMKITTPEDLPMAEAILKAREAE